MFISIVQELLPYLFYASVTQASQNNEKDVYSYVSARRQNKCINSTICQI